MSDLHLVDLDGARSGKQANRSIVAAIAAESGLDIQLGGGIRDRESFEKWLAHGVTRCVIGSLAVTQPETVKRWVAEFGADTIVFALGPGDFQSARPWLMPACGPRKTRPGVMPRS